MNLRSGLAESLPYSLSRWTDVPAAKWPWFLDRMKAGYMEGFDPRTAIPAYWSLKPEDTLGLIFWTKNPENLIEYADLLRPYNLRVHVTITGWKEEEPGVPRWVDTATMARRLGVLFGWDRITWRFSPVPIGLDRHDLLTRFDHIAWFMSPFQSVPGGGIKNVFLSFLQPNDRIGEDRGLAERVSLMREMATIAARWGMNVRLCNEDRTLLGVDGLPANLSPGVCAPPEDFSLPGIAKPPSEGCGCTLAVEAFTINESCAYGCRYCYAADETLSGRKRNTTKGHLPVVR